MHARFRMATSSAQGKDKQYLSGPEEQSPQRGGFAIIAPKSLCGGSTDYHLTSQSAG